MDSFKTVAILLLVLCLQPGGSLYSQSTQLTITLKETNSPLEKVMREIARQTGFTYFGDAVWMTKAHRVTINVVHVTLQEALDSCFRDQPLTYELVEGNSISIQEKREGHSIVVRGTVSNEKGEPVPGATVQVRGGAPGKRGASTMSNEQGVFVIHLSEQDSILQFSSINYEPRQLHLTGSKEYHVRLSGRILELENVAVTPSDGYQRIPKDRATGSFTTLDKELISRRVSTNIIDRLEGVTSSLLFIKNPVAGINQSVLSIRGRSTIYGSPDPVIVIDNFPYNGDISNINPEDVESITILKDAAAASIWGAFSGNGVIVISTKKGKYNQAPKFSFNTSVTAGKRPDLYYKPILSSSDYIDVEQMLFDSSFYSGKEANPLHPALSPVVETLIKRRDGLIDSATAKLALDNLRGGDIRRDEAKYFYRPSLNTQYSLNMSGGTAKHHYYVSGGYDRNRFSLVRNGYQRVTLNGSDTYMLIPEKLELSGGINFTSSHRQDHNSGNVNYPEPYLSLADGNGEALALPVYFRESYLDTVGGGGLLDWHYRPLDELRNANNTTRLQDYRLNLGLKYTIMKGVGLELHYQYGHGTSDQRNLQSLQTYFTRDLINSFSYRDATGAIRSPIPRAGIMDVAKTNYDVNNGRVQLNIDRKMGKDHVLTAITGFELRDVESRIRTNRYYGYDADHPNGVVVDYAGTYAQYVSGSAEQIPQVDHVTATSDRYVSYYINAAYTYKGRYTLTGSARRDESNLFGVNANQRGVPLWSGGMAWNIAKESFYSLDWLPSLRLRVTDGYNGNVDRNVSAYTTVYITAYPNSFGQTTATINNPPNPYLRWERTNILNMGIDFGTRGSRIGGSLEYYIKSGRDLIANSPLDPTTGNIYFTGNTANMRANGVDLNLFTKNLTGVVRWSSYLLFSYVRDKVTHYDANQGALTNYVNAGSISPVVGRPLYSVYAFRWEGLDPMNGNPQGLFKGKVSEDYSSIYNSTNLNDLVYKGPVNPPFFGSFRNDVYWNHFGLSVNLVYKLGYVFRRNSILYNSLFNGILPGHPDYRLRWQKPGDELHTSVPSMRYPGDFSRDNFYNYSEVLVEKGDHIRLQDLQLSYELPGRLFPKMPVANARVYLYANNIGIIWKANHQGIDPDYVNSIPNPRTVALGFKLDF